MSDSASLAAITELMDRWKQAFEACDVADMVSLFTEDAVFQGVNSPLRIGKDEISAYYAKVTAGTEAAVEILSAIQLRAETIRGTADVLFTAPTGEVHPVRLSVVAEYHAERWSITHYHATSRRRRQP